MQKKHLKSTGVRLVGIVLAALVLTACHPMSRFSRFENPHKMGDNPPLKLTLAPTQAPTEVAAAEAKATLAPTEEPTDVPTVTPTDATTPAPAAEQPTAKATVSSVPQPTATSRSAAAPRPTATPTAQPTPIVVIPNGFTAQVDSVRGYSLALPRGYALLDLRSAQFRNMASTLGMGAQLTTLTDFLDSPAGEMVGILAAADLPGMIFGGLPTILQVLVIDAPAATQETAQIAMQRLLTGQGGFLSNPVIETIENATINNLPGVRAKVTGDLAGANRPMAGTVIGLLANQKFYVLMQLTEPNKRTAKEPIFEQIIGTFRPE